MKKITILFVLLFSVLLNAQVGVNTTNPDPSSMLDITATNKGVLVPRVSLTNVTTTMLDGTNTAATGLLIWNTNAATVGGNGIGFYFFNGTQWIPITQTITGNTLDQSYDQGGAGVGKNIEATDGAVRINGDDGFLVTGTYGSGNTIDTEITGTGTRMFFNPRKAAFRAGYIVGNQWNNIGIGNFSTAFGSSTIASANISTAFGFNSVASGLISTAFGDSTNASGVNSTAFGASTNASGENSTAFGMITRAIGDDSTAFGRASEASGERSTAFGFGSDASGSTSTAFGDSTMASGSRSTAFGFFSDATGDSASTAFGHFASASGSSSTAFGYYTSAIGEQSTAFGNNTTSFGVNSTAFGNETMASGLNSTAFGNSTTASGVNSTAFGENSNATGNYSTSFGYATDATGENSTSFGFGTNATGNYSTAFGYFNDARSFGETVFGIGATFYTPSTNGASSFGTANMSDRLFVIGNGVDINNNNIFDSNERRNALVMLKNGNTGLGWSTPEERLHVQGSIRMVDGNQAAGRVLKSDANGTASWQIDNDNQTIDVFSLTGTTLNLSLQNDGVATQSVNLAALNTDNQTIDVFSLTGTTLNLSLSNDGVATQTVNLTSLANDWKLTGNTGTNPTFNFLGTTDNQDVSIRTNNTEKVRITAKGQIETTQLQSVWIGSSAGENATGTRNVFVGNSSGLSTSTGSDNTAIGGLTLLSNTTGFDNTAIGLASLYSLSSGDGNTAIGEQTLENFTTGSYNTFVGHLAGENYPSGLRNTIMGFQAGQNASGDGNVFIGSNAGRNSTAGNRLFIENNGADENNALIYGEFDNDILRTNSEFQVRQNSSGTLSHVLLREEGANDGARIKFTNAAEADNEWVLYGRADNTVADSRFHIYHNGTGDIVRITGNGLVGIMRTPTTNALEVNGTASKTTAGGFVANSDSRLKKDIATISPNEALEKILQLRGVTYYWNDDKTGTVRPENLQIGFIAQEIAEIFPEKVTEDNLGFLQTAYGDYDPIVFQAIKALNDKIEKLENENSALKSALEKVNALEAKLEQMNIK